MSDALLPIVVEKSDNALSRLLPSFTAVCMAFFKPAMAVELSMPERSI